MTRLPVVSGREFVRRLERVGYSVVRQRGSHIRLHHPARKPLTIPNHSTIKPGLLNKILKDVELTIKEFNNLR